MFWMCFFNNEWTFHSFLVFFCLYTLEKARGTQNTEIPGCNILARFNPRPAGVHVGGQGGSHNVSTIFGIFLSILPAWNKWVWLVWGIGHFMGRKFGGGRLLFSYSGCWQEETHFHHPDRRGSLQIHVLGWPHPSGLLRPQSILGRKGRKERRFCKICVYWQDPNLFPLGALSSTSYCFKMFFLSTLLWLDSQNLGKHNFISGLGTYKSWQSSFKFWIVHLPREKKSLHIGFYFYPLN